MTSPKLLLALMATVAVHAAPQINEREVVGEVIQSLGPAIQQALASLGSSSSSSSSSSFGSSPIVGRVSSTSSVSRPQTSRRNTFVSAPTGVTRSASGPSVSSQLQPSIVAAVAEALKASSRPVSRPQVSSYKAVEEPNYGPAKYNFGYKVADEDSQAYINHQESREGNDVTGTYNYVNPAGALVTVSYEAGVDGFSQTRDVEQGAVQMRNIPGAWTGPLAGVDEPNSIPATTSSVSNNRGRVSSSSSSSQLSEEALISQILSSIQPKITSAVQGALSSSVQTAGRRTVVQQVAAAPRPLAVRVAAPRPIASRPRPGVIAPSSRRVQSSSSSRGVQSSSSRGNLGDVFGNGETSVKFATPQFQFEF